MYAKLVNGTIRSAPKQVQYNGNTVINPSPDKLLELGYLPVVYTDMPMDAPEGQHYESHLEQTNAEITQVWVLVDDPVVSEEITAEEALAIITGGAS